MSKFKIGDRVKLISGRQYGINTGDTGTVAEDSSVPFVDWDGGKGRFAFLQSDLELIKWHPKVGDRVRFIRDSTAGGPRYGARGDVATVTLLISKEAVDVKLDVDKYRIGFNPSTYVRDLEPLPVAVVAEQAQPAAWVPSVGDRVVCVKDYRGSFTAGKEYVVRYFEPKEPRIGVVENDCGDPDGIGAHYFGPIVKPFKIEAGKFYKTRDGRKVGPAFIGGSTATFGTKDNWQSAVWVDNGRASPRNDTTELENDIIIEWVDEPAAASNDNATKPKFKAGDRVRILRIRDVFGCEAKYNRHLIGSIVTLESRNASIEQAGESWQAWDVVGGSPWWVRSDDVELVTPTTTQPTAIVALIEDGQPKPATRPYVHASVEAATKEAERLAGVHKGQEFGVYVLQSTVKQEKPVYEHEWQRLAAKGRKIDAIRELREATGLHLATAKVAIEDWLHRAAVLRAA